MFGGLLSRLHYFSINSELTVVVCLAKPSRCHGSTSAKHQRLWLVATRHAGLDSDRCGLWLIHTEVFSLFESRLHPRSKITPASFLRLCTGNCSKSVSIRFLRYKAELKSIPVTGTSPGRKMQLNIFVCTGTPKRSLSWRQRCRDSKTWRPCWTRRMRRWLRLWERSVTWRWKAGIWRPRLPRWIQSYVRLENSVETHLGSIFLQAASTVARFTAGAP